MTNRQPTYPGRVVLTPVIGAENTYIMERADEPSVVGTPLNKSTLLTDATATQMGLSGDPTVNDALAAAVPLLGSHIWHRRTAAFTWAQGSATSFSNGGKSNAGTNTTLYVWSTAPTIQENGYVDTSGSTTVYISYNTAASSPGQLSGKYFAESTNLNGSAQLYYCTGNLTTSHPDGGAYFWTAPCKPCTRNFAYGAWSDTLSTNASAYTQGISGGYENRLTRTYKSGTVNALRWAKGVYVGTGSQTSRHTIVTINTDFPPQVIFISRSAGGSEAIIIAFNGQSSASPIGCEESSYAGTVYLTWGSTSVTVKSGSSSYTNWFDSKGVPYTWFAIG